MCSLCVRASVHVRVCVCAMCVRACVLSKLFMSVCVRNTRVRARQYSFIICISFVLIVVFLFYFVASACVLPVRACCPSTCVYVCACILSVLCMPACVRTVRVHAHQCFFLFLFCFCSRVSVCSLCVCAVCPPAFSTYVGVRACCLCYILVCPRAC